MTPEISQLVLPIVTERLVLRDFRASDAAAMQRYMEEPSHWLYQLVAEPTRDHIQAVIQNIFAGQAAAVRDHYVLAVTLKDAPASIIGEGIVSRDTDHTHRQGEIGFGLAHACWGQGYGSEIVMALVAAGFGQMHLHHLTGRCSPDNLASARVMEKAGMRREALLRDLIFARGRWWSTAIYGVLEGEFAPVITRALAESLEP
jgi:ribosomal-protein-alanine N-acetyltransferase